jgi:hypothetical protein
MSGSTSSLPPLTRRNYPHQTRPLRHPSILHMFNQLLREDQEIAEELKGEYLGTGLMIRCFYQLPHAATIIITYRMGTPSAEIISAIRLR